MASKNLELIRHTGLSEKAARIYLATLELGESSVQDMAEKSGVKRTSMYYVLNELLDAGAIFQVQRDKKTRYIAETIQTLLERARERLSTDEVDIEGSLAPRQERFRKPKIYFLYGPYGFKKIWDMIFASGEKEFRIITNGKGFLDFAKERYIIEHIIKTKRQRGIKSRHIIVDSPYARTIVAKDPMENRQSKFLPKSHSLPFTEVITENFTAFISPRFDNTLFIVENRSFAETRKQLFEELWSRLPSPTADR